MAIYLANVLAERPAAATMHESFPVVSMRKQIYHLIIYLEYETHNVKRGHVGHICMKLRSTSQQVLCSTVCPHTYSGHWKSEAGPSFCTVALKSPSCWDLYKQGHL